MLEKAINFEKDYLVIYKDVQGKFHSFRWFSAENTTREEMTAKIYKWNQREERIDDCLQAELITDQLVREICAYREKTQPFDILEENLTEAMKEIEKAQDYLQTALSALERIGDTE
jgi:endonuclease III-like uncharacterized protein